MICKTINKHLNSSTTIKSNLSWDKVLKSHLDVSERFLIIQDFVSMPAWASQAGLPNEWCRHNVSLSFGEFAGLFVCFWLKTSVTSKSSRFWKTEVPFVPDVKSASQTETGVSSCDADASKHMDCLELVCLHQNITFPIINGYFTIRVKEEPRYAAWRLFLIKPFFHFSAHIWPRLYPRPGRTACTLVHTALNQHFCLNCLDCWMSSSGAITKSKYPQ